VGYNFFMLPRFLLTTCLLLALAACAPAPASQAPVCTETPTPPAKATFTNTDQPTPTHVSVPAEPHTETEETSVPTVEPTLEPTIEETPVPLSTPVKAETAAATSVPEPAEDASAIQLYSPGPLSKIISPLNVYGYAIPGYKHKGRVDLYGEDGRLVASEILQLNTAYKWAYFYWPLPFEISSVGELGRLSMSTQDQYGRITALYSVHLLLLPEGDSILNPPGDLGERCTILEPAQGTHPSGGILSVSGTMEPFNTLPLTVQLIGRDGIALASGLVPLEGGDEKTAKFRIDIPYILPTATWELLTVSQFDDRIGGLMYLYSQEILLRP
jgi:hypothetical protein